MLWTQKYLQHQAVGLRNLWDSHMVNPHSQNQLFKQTDPQWSKDVQKFQQHKTEMNKKKQRNYGDYHSILILIPSFNLSQHDVRMQNFQSMKSQSPSKKKKKDQVNSPRVKQISNKSSQIGLKNKRSMIANSHNTSQYEGGDMSSLRKTNNMFLEPELYENLLPFSKHSNKLQCNNYRIKFTTETVNKDIFPKLVQREEFIRDKYLKSIIIDLRKKHRNQMAIYKEVLQQFVVTQEKSIRLERARLLLLTDVNILRDIQKKEDVEEKRLLQGNDGGNKAQDQGQKNINIKFLQDHLPFGSQVMAIADKMYQSKALHQKNMMAKPAFRLKLDQRQFEEGIRKIYDDVNNYYAKLLKEEENKMRRRRKEMHKKKKNEVVQDEEN